MAKTLLIVESPTKAKTIKKFLGNEFDVISSFGHIRDLPKTSMGVDFENHFAPKYVIPRDKADKVKALKAAAKNVDEIYLATDEDREGEAIAWHIAHVLDIDPKDAKRITFHEITKRAIESAVQKPRNLAMDLIDAQQTRRILDRIVGYELSPFLWKKVQRGLSAGRVQSVAVRLIVEREREREKFKIEEYWTIEGQFEKDANAFEAKLIERDGKKIEKLGIKTKEEAEAIKADTEGADFSVHSIEKKHASKKPPTPLRTSVLQQEANNTLGFSAKQTMTLAQKLYETGRITYMRTDSLNLSENYLQEAQAFINQNFGKEYANGSTAYKTKDKSAQEAHEAIRPTDVNATPESLQGTLEAGQWKLYNLIWRRTLASQMPAAKIERTTVDIKAKDYVFRANGSIVVFDGYMKVYRGSADKLLPDLNEGDKVIAKQIDAKQHFTEPPARYSDATLVKALEEYGIGRPSTYAPTIGTIEARGYVERDDNKKLAPTEIAGIVTDLLVEHFPEIIDFEFTAQMEKTLDDIADGGAGATMESTLGGFYGPFHKNIETKTKDVSRDDVLPAQHLGNDPKTGLPIHVKTGRFGPYVQLGDYTKEDAEAEKEKPRRASIPKDMKMADMTLEIALKLLTLPRELGVNEDGEKIVVQTGPYGPYLKVGKVNVSLPEGNDPYTITLEDAKRIAKEEVARKKEEMKPIAELGKNEEGKKILVKNGRFGPYVTDGTKNASVPKSMDPKEVTLEQAIEILAKKRGRKKK